MVNLDKEINDILQPIQSQITTQMIPQEQVMQAKAVEKQAVTKVKSLEELLNRIEEIFAEDD